MYDPECLKLAQYFFGDLASRENPRLVKQLAQEIQDCVENWLQQRRDGITENIRQQQKQH